MPDDRLIARCIGKIVHVHWLDEGYDWPSFRVLAVDGDEVWLRGVDTPDGAKHSGDSFICGIHEFTLLSYQCIT